LPDEEGERTDMSYKFMTADEAACEIRNSDMVALSGFTYAGAPKALPMAIARRAKELQERNLPFKIKVLSGASISEEADNAMAEANAVEWRAPFQSASKVREKINEGSINFVDMHLSEVSQAVEYGFFGDIDIAIIEASDVTRDGKVYLTSGIGSAPVFLRKAKKIIIELNAYHNPRVSEMADISILGAPPRRHRVSFGHPLEKIGDHFVRVEPSKIAGIVETNMPDTRHSHHKENPTCARIADNVVGVLLNELTAGRIPPEFLPLQSGIGNINNAVMKRLAANQDIPPFLMFSEVIQDSVIPMIENRKILGASASSLTVRPDTLERIYGNMDFFSKYIVLRPQEISNHPALIRRLGVIALNVGLEFDLYGNANSTHVAGTSLVNGIGGSGDFGRNAYLSIFMAPSVAKDGKISSIVPMCAHMDQSEHSVKILVTEQGVADLRGLSPIHRAERVIENCVHPMYRDYMRRYLESSSKGHIHHNLRRAFELHINFIERGTMLPD
jgi:succinate CoA transferase